MKVLVTGGAGFIGSHLVDKLVLEGHSVLVVDDMSGGESVNVREGVEIFRADCRDEYAMDYIFSTYRFDTVYHLAADAAENKAQFSPVEVTSRNYDAFIKVLKAFIANNGKRFIFTSSIAVYGDLQTPFLETDRPHPEDLYGITKYAAEQTLAVMSKVHDFEYVIARPHNVYGERQNMRDPYRNVVTIWMNSLLRNKPLYIYGDGEQKRCFSYISDVISSLYRCGTDSVSGKTFNIGADSVYTLNDLARTIEKVSGIPQDLRYLPQRPQEVKEAVADHTEAKKLLQYNDSVSLEEGIRRTWEWVKREGAKEPIYTKLEIPSSKVPENWKV